MASGRITARTVRARGACSASSTTPTFQGRSSFQIAFLAGAGLARLGHRSRTRRAISSEPISPPAIGFLDRTAGFGIVQALIDYAMRRRSYGRARAGRPPQHAARRRSRHSCSPPRSASLVGVARLSSQLAGCPKIATAFVEIIRNIPLLLQLFFWYFAVLRSVPGMREKWTFLGIFHINIGGLHIPRPVHSPRARSSWSAQRVLVGYCRSRALRRPHWGRRGGSTRTGRKRRPSGWISRRARCRSAARRLLPSRPPDHVRRARLQRDRADPPARVPERDRDDDHPGIRRAGAGAVDLYRCLYRRSRPRRHRGGEPRPERGRRHRSASSRARPCASS